MPAERKPLPLDQANKLIFVKEFDRALDELAAICRAQPWHVEALFRCVELAVRVGREHLAQELLDAEHDLSLIHI